MRPSYLYHTPRSAMSGPRFASTCELLLVLYFIPFIHI